MSSTMPRLAAHGQDAGEGAERHHEVDGDVDEDALHALLGAGGEADQRVAHMADRRIGHQPLDVGLADRRERAEQHRGDGEEDDDLLPLPACTPAKASRSTTRTIIAIAAILGAAAKNAVTGVGAPS
jgi:hypothetical protein